MNLQTTILTPEILLQLFPQITRQIELDRLQHFIEESEFEFVKEKITDALYIELLDYINLMLETGIERTFDKTFDFTFNVPADKNEAFEGLLNGGRFIAQNCNDSGVRVFKGLFAAIAYYTFSKLISQNDKNVTRFGYVVKNDEYSESIDFKTQQYEERKYQNIADRYISDCITFVKSHPAYFTMFSKPILKGRINITVLN